MDSELVKQLGPLAPLACVWDGDTGSEAAPSDDRGTEQNAFRERITFEPISRAHNHEQVLYGLRYATVAWRIAKPNKEDSQLRMPGRPDLFHHTDENTLTRVTV